MLGLVPLWCLELEQTKCPDCCCWSGFRDFDVVSGWLVCLSNGALFLLVKCPSQNVLSGKREDRLLGACPVCTIPIPIPTPTPTYHGSHKAHDVQAVNCDRQIRNSECELMSKEDSQAGFQRPHDEG
jgi:hypothetical protein